MHIPDISLPKADFDPAPRDIFPGFTDLTAPPRIIPAAMLSGRAFRARALLLAERVDLRALRASEIVATNPLMVALEGGGLAVLFRYGVAVFFGVSASAEAAFIGTLRPFLGEPYETPETEEVEIRIDPASHEGMQDETLHLETLTTCRLQIIADVLSKSVVLATYESRVGQSFDRIEPLAHDLERKGRLGGNVRQLLRQVGAMLQSEHMMMGSVEISEKPEMLWDQPALEGLFLRVEDEFEIRERHAVLERKLKFISKTVRTLIELLHSRHSLKVEWYIVLLIVAEIFLTVYPMIGGGK